MEKKHILFVVNPISGDSRKDDFVASLSWQSGTYSFSYDLFHTTGQEDLSKLRAAIEASKPSIVMAVGGDGTVNLAAQVLKHTETPLGIIPFGSANGMATELEIPMKPNKALAALLGGKPVQLDMLVFNETYWGLRMGDMGFNARMVQRFDREERRGFLGYVRSFFQEILNTSLERYLIKWAGGQYRKKAFMLIMANATKYGSGATINPEGRLNDGLLEICVFKQLTFGSILLLSWQMFFGSLKKSPHVKIIQLSEAQIQAKQPQLLQIDGEVIGDFKKLRVRVAPRCLWVLQPAAGHRLF